jgi:hypothetical protein
MNKLDELSNGIGSHAAATGGNIINTNKSEGEDPLQQLNKILETVSSAPRFDALFTDESEKPILTLNYVETVISEFAEKAQNPQMSNKWIDIDGKLLKALKVFRSELRILLAGQAQMGAAQATLQSEIPPEAPIPSASTASSPQKQTAADRALPTEEA